MPADPIARFRRWFADAERTGMPLPEAIALRDRRSARAAGRVRYVLLKHVDARGFVFFHRRAEPEGSRARGQSRGGSCRLLGRARKAGAGRRARGDGEHGRGGGLLGDAAVARAASPRRSRTRARCSPDGAISSPAGARLDAATPGRTCRGPRRGRVIASRPGRSSSGPAATSACTGASASSGDAEPRE